MNRKFKYLKKKSVREFYKNFTENLIKSNPKKFYSTVKQIGGLGVTTENDLQIGEIEGLSDYETAEVIADYFSSVSRQYHEVDFSKLPSYLTPQV